MSAAQQKASPWVVIAGEVVYEWLMAAKEAAVPKSSIPGREDCYASDHLCAWQSKCHTLGYEGAQLVESMYGWTLRYDSGLNNFAIIAGARRGDVLDGSLECAIEYAKEWCGRSSGYRYVLAPREVIENYRASIAQAAA